jgi:hypothetical protein
MSTTRKPPHPRHRPIMLHEVAAIADRFWAELDALAARATPDQRTNVITLGIAAIGHRLGERAQVLIVAAAGVEAKCLAGRASA